MALLGVLPVARGVFRTRNHEVALNNVKDVATGGPERETGTARGAGEGWDSPLAKKYHVRGVPKIFVLDRKGRIAGRDLPGRHLEKLMQSLLN